MSVVKQNDGRKWINAIVAISAILIGYYVILFVGQLGEWFDLEAKVNHFHGVSQGIGVLAGLSVFLYVLKSDKCSTFLNEVFAELVKVIWPDKDSVVKLTIGIVIALVICSVVLFMIDYLSRYVLGFFY